MKKSENQSKNCYCFACGESNPVGLHLKFQMEGDRYTMNYVVPREYQSYDGIVHGEIVSTMIDEAMGGCLYAQGRKAVTARLEIRYRQATPVGEPIKIASWIKSQRGNFIDMEATISLLDGTITAEGKAKMAVVEE